MKKYVIGALAGVLMSGSASAATNLVQNGGFEQTTLTRSQQFIGNQVTGWTNAARPGQHTGFGYNFLVNPNTADSTGFYSIAGNHDWLYGPAGSGSNQVRDPNGVLLTTNASANGFTGTSPSGGNFLLADGDTNFHGAISQVIGNLVAGNTYTLTFDWAGASWYTTPGTTTERFDVTFGGNTQATETVTLGSKGFSGWKNASMNFVAGGTSQTLSFLAQGTPNGLPPSLLLDNVSLTAAVPEPSTWMTMILGFGMIGGLMRRRRTATLRLA